MCVRVFVLLSSVFDPDEDLHFAIPPPFQCQQRKEILKIDRPARNFERAPMPPLNS